MGRLIDLDKVEFLKVDGNIEFNHGVDCCVNRLLKQPTVEAIPKAQYDELKANITMMRLDYEARLKADMVAMLTEIQLEIEEVKTQSGFDEAWDGAVKQCSEIIQQKIDKLKEETEVKDDKS